MELQGICHKMHAGLKDHSVTDQQVQKANVEYKFILDRSEIDLPFQLRSRDRTGMDRQYLLCFLWQKNPEILFARALL